MEPILNPSNLLDFKHRLGPILEMLAAKEKTMSREEWVSLVNLSRERIISIPEQYLPGEIPPPYIMNETVNLVFDELQGKNLRIEELTEN